LLAIVGLAADDDDGNEASRRPQERREPAPAQRQEPRIASGPASGKLLSEATNEELTDYGYKANAVLDDASKQQHHARAEEVVDAINAEFEKRAK
jgi:hypothetical protein